MPQLNTCRVLVPQQIPHERELPLLPDVFFYRLMFFLSLDELLVKWFFLSKKMRHFVVTYLVKKKIKVLNIIITVYDDYEITPRVHRIMSHFVSEDLLSRVERSKIGNQNTLKITPEQTKFHLIRHILSTIPFTELNFFHTVKIDDCYHFLYQILVCLKILRDDQKRVYRTNGNLTTLRILDSLNIKSLQYSERINSIIPVMEGLKHLTIHSEGEGFIFIPWGVMPSYHSSTYLKTLSLKIKNASVLKNVMDILRAAATLNWALDNFPEVTLKSFFSLDEMAFFNQKMFVNLKKNVAWHATFERTDYMTTNFTNLHSTSVIVDIDHYNNLLAGLTNLPKLKHLFVDMIFRYETDELGVFDTLQDFEPPSTLLATVETLHLKIDFNSHEEFKWLNLTQTFPNLKKFYLIEFNCKSCNVTSSDFHRMHHRTRSVAKANYCFTSCFDSLERLIGEKNLSLRPFREDYYLDFGYRGANPHFEGKATKRRIENALINVSDTLFHTTPWFVAGHTL